VIKNARPFIKEPGSETMRFPFFSSKSAKSQSAKSQSAESPPKEYEEQEDNHQYGDHNPPAPIKSAEKDA
jgi:hypothetical protein